MNKSRDARILEPAARMAPLTAIQRYWLHSMKEGKLDNPIVSTIARLVPRCLDLDRLSRALGQVAHRHEPLRTRIVTICGEPMQAIDADPQINFKAQSFAHLGVALACERARRGIAVLAAAPRDLARDHGFGAIAFDLGDAGQVVALHLDHLFSDPVSMDILWTDLANAYAGSINARAPDASRNPQLADYALEEHSLTEDDRRIRRSHHLATICGITFPQLAGQHEACSPPGYDTRVVPFEIDRDTVAAICGRARDLATTPPMFLFGAFAVATARWANRTALVVCMPLTLRREVEWEDVVGFLSTNHPLRVVLGAELLGAFFERLTGSILEAHECATVPAELFAGADGPPFDEICFNFIPRERRSDKDKFESIGDFTHEVTTQRHFSSLMAVLLEQGDGSLQGYLGHNRSLFSPMAMAALLDDFLATARRWTVQEDV